MCILRLIRRFRSLRRRLLGNQTPLWAKEVAHLLKYVYLLPLVFTLKMITCNSRHFFKSIPAIVSGKKSYYMSPVQFMTNLILLQFLLVKQLTPKDIKLSETTLHILILLINSSMLIVVPIVITLFCMIVLLLWGLVIMCPIWPMTWLAEIPFNYRLFIVPLSFDTYKSLDWRRFFWSMGYFYLYFYSMSPLLVIVLAVVVKSYFQFLINHIDPGLSDPRILLSLVSPVPLIAVSVTYGVIARPYFFVLVSCVRTPTARMTISGLSQTTRGQRRRRKRLNALRDLALGKGALADSIVSRIASDRDLAPELRGRNANPDERMALNLWGVTLCVMGAVSKVSDEEKRAFLNRYHECFYFMGCPEEEDERQVWAVATSRIKTLSQRRYQEYFDAFDEMMRLQEAIRHDASARLVPGGALMHAITRNLFDVESDSLLLALDVQKLVMSQVIAFAKSLGTPEGWAGMSHLVEQASSALQNESAWYRLFGPRFDYVTAEETELGDNRLEVLPAWDEVSFFLELQGRRGKREASACRAILDWANHLGLEKDWEKGEKDGSFTIRFLKEGLAYSLLSAYTHGRVEVLFERIKKTAPFDDKAKRLELCRRFNLIRDVRVEGDVIEARSSIPLATLARHDGVARLCDALKWAIEEATHATEMRGE